MLSLTKYGPCWDVIPCRCGQTSAKTCASCFSSSLICCSILLFNYGSLSFFHFQSTLSENHAPRICVSSTEEPGVDGTEFPSFPFQTQSRNSTWPSLSQGSAFGSMDQNGQQVLGKGAPLLSCGFGYRSSSWRRREI